MELYIVVAVISFFIGYCVGEWREFKLWFDAGARR